MKKAIYTLFLSLVTILPAFAADGNEFAVDRSKINREMGALNDLERYVNDHQGITANQVNAEEINTSDMKGISQILDSEPPLGIPSFWWGFGGACIGGASMYGVCWLGVAAVAFVYFMTDENKEEAKKAALGCVVGTAVGILVAFLFFAVALGYGFYGIY